MDCRYATVLVVGLVIFSGCNLFAGGAGPTSPTSGDGTTGTPAPTASTAASGQTPANSTVTPTLTRTTTPPQGPTPTVTSPATPTPSGPYSDLEPVSTLPRLPDGVTRDGVRNVTALYRGHLDLLATGGYEYTVTEVTNSSATGSTTERFRLANDTVSTETNLTATGDVFGSGSELSVYRGPEIAGIFNRTADAVQYGYGPTNVRLVAELATTAVAQRSSRYVTAPDWRIAGANSTVISERRVVLVADSLRGTVPDQREGDEVRSVDARMALTPAGLVRSLDVAVTLERSNGATLTRTVSVSVADLQPETLSAPDWFSSSPRLEASLEEDDRLFSVRHAGGADVEAETSLTVGGRLAALGDVTVDRRLSEGDVLYVYATEENGNSSLEHAVNQRPTLPENATAFDGRVVVSGTQGSNEFSAAADPDEE